MREAKPKLSSEIRRFKSTEVSGVAQSRKKLALVIESAFVLPPLAPSAASPSDDDLCAIGTSDQIVKRASVFGMEPDAAVRRGISEVPDVIGAVDCISAGEEN